MSQQDDVIDEESITLNHDFGPKITSNAIPSAIPTSSKDQAESWDAFTMPHNIDLQPKSIIKGFSHGATLYQGSKRKVSISNFVSSRFQEDVGAIDKSTNADSVRHSKKYGSHVDRFNKLF